MNDRALRIAVFTDSALPILNGVSVSVDALCSELRRQGHSVHLFTVRVPRHKDSDPNIHRVFGLETPLSRGYPVAIPPFYRLLLKFRRQKFDLIHTHSPFMMGMVGLRWAESHDLPIVSTYHTLYDRYAHYFPVLPRRYVRFKIAKHTNFYYNHVDHVITPSDASSKWLRRHSVNTPVTVIPTGGQPVQLLDRTETRVRLGISPESKILLYVGRLAKEKNLETLIEATSRIFAEDPHTRLWIVGDGPYRDECVAMVRARRMGDRVKFLGFKPREEVDPFYAAADLFMFTSITETQGLVVQEAMSYGLPAVAVIGGGASASILHGENGYIAKNDPQSVADFALEILRDDQLSASFSTAARRTARGFTVEEMTARVVEVYRRVLEESKMTLAVEKSLAEV